MIGHKDKYRMYASLISKEHETLIDTIDKAIAEKQHKKNAEEIKNELHNLIRDVVKHFANEEYYMIESKYPGYQYHKEEHQHFPIKALAYRKRIINSDSQAANEILVYLKQWLVNHFQETDKKYTEYFSKNGHSKSLHYSP